MSDKKQWQYRAVVVEFQKGGLLGDKYIDEEDVETALNEEGRSGWELTTATMIPDGLLLCLRRERQPGEEGHDILAAEEDRPAEDSSPLGSIRIF
jgi:hypothetical protein